VTDRVVYLPKGEWVSYATGESYEGEKVHLVHAELEDLPIFVRKGSAVMQGEWNSNQDKATKSLTMKIYASNTDENYRFTFYDDDGETFSYENSEYLKADLEIKSSEDSIEVVVLDMEGNYKPAYQEIRVEVIGSNDPVLINGKESTVIKL
jgi:alpha-glucosidase